MFVSKVGRLLYIPFTAVKFAFVECSECAGTVYSKVRIITVFNGRIIISADVNASYILIGFLSSSRFAQGPCRTRRCVVYVVGDCACPYGQPTWLTTPICVRTHLVVNLQRVSVGQGQYLYAEMRLRKN